MILKIHSEPRYYIEFTDEQLNELGLKKGDRFDISEKDGEIVLIKHKTIEIDLDVFPRETLMLLIKRSIEEDVSVNDIIVDALKEVLKYEKSSF